MQFNNIMMLRENTYLKNVSIMSVRLYMLIFMILLFVLIYEIQLYVMIFVCVVLKAVLEMCNCSTH